MEEQQRAWEQKDQNQSQTGSQINIQEAKKVAVVNRWKACSTEGAKGRTKETHLAQELSETQAKLQKAEKTITVMREQVHHLQTSLRSAQEYVNEQNKYIVVHIDRGTNTETGEADRVLENFVSYKKDGAESEPGQNQLQVTANVLLTTLRRLEAMVNSALDTAELVRQSENRVSQVTVKMENITHRVEEALHKAGNTAEQLNLLEARTTEPATSQVCVKNQCLRKQSLVIGIFLIMISNGHMYFYKNVSVLKCISGHGYI